MAAGTDITFAEQEEALGSTWSKRGSKVEKALKEELLSLVAESAVRVERPIPPHFCGPGFPFEEGSTCMCLEFVGDKMPRFDGLLLQRSKRTGRPSISAGGPLLSILFQGHPEHSTGLGGLPHYSPVP